MILWTCMSRLMLLTVLAFAVITGPCVADPTPLPPGKPAGTKQAEGFFIDPLLFWTGVLLFLAGGYELSKVPTPSASTTGTGS
jgi:hypothetical protein